MTRRCPDCRWSAERDDKRTLVCTHPVMRPTDNQRYLSGDMDGYLCYDIRYNLRFDDVVNCCGREGHLWEARS